MKFRAGSTTLPWFRNAPGPLTSSASGGKIALLTAIRESSDESTSLFSTRSAGVSSAAASTSLLWDKATCIRKRRKRQNYSETSCNNTCSYKAPYQYLQIMWGPSLCSLKTWDSSLSILAVLLCFTSVREHGLHRTYVPQRQHKQHTGCSSRCPWHRNSLKTNALCRTSANL